MARRTGLYSVLLLSGATRPDEVPGLPAALRPDLVLPDVSHLVPWLDGQAVGAEGAVDEERPAARPAQNLTEELPRHVRGVAGFLCILRGLSQASLPAA